MPAWLENLVVGWPMIRANLPTFFAIVIILIIAIWAIIYWSFRAILGSKTAQIELLDRQIADYRLKLHGATPDEAKARIDSLEARLKSIEPRRLVADRRLEFIEALRAAAAPSSIAIIAEAAGDSPQFAADLARGFREAGWHVTEGGVMGIGNRPDSGIALQFSEINNAPQFARAVMSALRRSAINFDIQQRPMPQGRPMEILVCTAIAR